jgi:hypothetical protein
VSCEAAAPYGVLSLSVGPGEADVVRCRLWMVAQLVSAVSKILPPTEPHLSGHSIY